MDTSQQATTRDKEGTAAAQRQRRSIAEKRRIVEETLAPGASVARIARAHGVNANQVFGWRRLYLAGRLGEQKPGIKLLPVRVSESKSAPVVVTLSKLSRKSETTVAIRYALSRWNALTRYIEDGGIEIDNNAAERSLRGVALGRKNYLKPRVRRVYYETLVGAQK